MEQKVPSRKTNQIKSIQLTKKTLKDIEKPISLKINASKQRFSHK
jgi:hypothetical protein